MHDIGGRISRLREIAGLTEWELAQKASISPGNLRQIEQGMRRPETATIERIASALGVCAEDLKTQDPRKELKSSAGIDDIRKIFGINVRNMRIKKGLTQKELAEELDHSLPWIQHVELGRHLPKPETWDRLANLFDCQIYHLFMVETPENRRHDDL